MARKILQIRVNSLLCDDSRKRLTNLWKVIVEKTKLKDELYSDIYDTLKLAGYDDVEN
jgi:hypothetical protein